MIIAGFFALGVAVGTIGSMVGVGGGFILVPLLMFLSPELGHARVTAISMVAVAFNATSSVISYFFRRLLHWRVALVLGLTSIPGAILGTRLQSGVERSSFYLIFGVVLFLYSAYLLKKSRAPKAAAASSADTVDDGPRVTLRQWSVGGAVGLVVGVLASFLGIGGGVIYVPLLHQFMRFRVQLAVGTSMAILGVTAWLSTLEHYRLGNLSGSWGIVLPVAAGAVVGAQIGSNLAAKVPGHYILRILAIFLGAASLRLIVSGWAG